MYSLQDLLGQQRGDQTLSQISQTVGADPSSVNAAINAALPAILAGLATNASTPEGAQSLDRALTNDHDGSVLDDLGGLPGLVFGGDSSHPPPRQADAGGILGHVLGADQGQVAQQVSEKSGLGMGQVAQILMMLAPVVMGYLGKQKQQQNVQADDLGGLLGGLLAGGRQQPADAISSPLDRERDGSGTDDIASIAYDYMIGGK
jgi:hypothetical protein